MLTLSLLRHAKASWDDLGCSDFDRQLAPRGLAAAPLMGRAMRAAGIRPALILCSAAKRTRQTLEHVLPELGSPAPTVTYDEKLYLAPPVSMMQVIHKLPKTELHVMMVGHNPGHHLLALELAGDGEPSALAALSEKFPTAALAVLTFKTNDWRNVAPASGTLTHFLTPRTLAAS
jgi:phosphohistidine phosphatase